MLYLNYANRFEIRWIKPDKGKKRRKMSRKFTKKSRKRASRASIKLANEQKAKKYANSTVPMEPNVYTDSGSPFSNRYASNRSSQVKIRSVPPDSEDDIALEGTSGLHVSSEPGYDVPEDTIFLMKKRIKNLENENQEISDSLKLRDECMEEFEPSSPSIVPLSFSSVPPQLAVESDEEILDKLIRESEAPIKDRPKKRFNYKKSANGDHSSVLNPSGQYKNVLPSKKPVQQTINSAQPAAPNPIAQYKSKMPPPPISNPVARYRSMISQQMPTILPSSAAIGQLQNIARQSTIQKNMPSCSDDVANTLVSSFMPEIGSILQPGAHLGDNGTRRRVQIGFVRKNISQE
eukprot:NP_494715.1 Uncharacterized protein CELE_W06A11.4 [Caenorhabditis elegans]